MATTTYQQETRIVRKWRGPIDLYFVTEDDEWYVSITKKAALELIADAAARTDTARTESEYAPAPAPNVTINDDGDLLMISIITDDPRFRGFAG